METIKIGSVVQTKAGGPKMMVESFGRTTGTLASNYKTEEDRSKVKCQWFEGNDSFYGTFPIISLNILE